VVAIEVLSYIDSWREVLDALAEIGDRVLVSLYLPPDPIGFVKSFAELRAELELRFTREAELLVNGDQLLWLGARHG
jgi:hypothetical protein